MGRGQVVGAVGVGVCEHDLRVQRQALLALAKSAKSKLHLHLHGVLAASMKYMRRERGAVHGLRNVTSGACTTVPQQTCASAVCSFFGGVCDDINLLKVCTAMTMCIVYSAMMYSV